MIHQIVGNDCREIAYAKPISNVTHGGWVSGNCSSSGYNKFVSTQYHNFNDSYSYPPEKVYTKEKISVPKT